MFYEKGVMHACRNLGLTKEASRWLLPLAGTIGGAGKGALVGGGVGGLTGAISAEKGQGWEGFKRGLGRGALAGAAVGGLGGVSRGLAGNAAFGREGTTELMRVLRAGGPEAQAIKQMLGPQLRGGSIVKGLAGGIAGATGRE